MTPLPRLQLPHPKIGRPVRAVKATSLANRTTGFARTPVLPAATPVGALSAQLRRPRLRSATAGLRRLRPSAARRERTSRKWRVAILADLAQRRSRPVFADPSWEQSSPRIPVIRCKGPCEAPPVKAHL